MHLEKLHYAKYSSKREYCVQYFTLPVGAWLPKTPRGGGGKGPLPEGRLFAEELLLVGEAGLCLDPGEFEASAKTHHN